MLLSLKTKLIVAFASILLLLTISLIYITNNAFIGEFEVYMSDIQKVIAKQIVHDTEMLYYDGTPPTEQELKKIGNEAIESGIAYTYLENDKEVFECLDNTCEYKQSETVDGEEVYSEEAFPIIYDSENVGEVKLKFYSDFYYSEFEVGFIDSIQSTHVTIAVVFFSIAILAALVFSKSISDPIKQVSDKAKLMKNGDYKHSIKTNTTTKEVVELVDALNNLSKSLTNQERIKKQMAENYAHEIRTPLSSISTTFEGVSDGIIKLDKRKIDSLLNEINRLSLMVDQLDNISKFNSKDVVIKRTKFNIHFLVNDVALLLENDFKTKNIDLKIVNNLSTCNEIIFADKDKINGVLINLLTNACKYSNENDSVVVKLEYIDNKHHISVIDTGIGIEKAEIPLIFEHLYRIDKSRVHSVKGYGVGLSVVKGIVDAHGGKIIVNSIVGEGTEFKIIL